MRIGGQIHRACIYFIFDKDGIVDDYILYQLKDMRNNVEFLHCVINGKLSESSKTRVNEIADEVYERENKGNDIGAYKAAIEYIGWDKLAVYDELVLMNFTCFGPVYPFKELFDWSEQQDIDLWALTWDKKVNWMKSDQYLHYNKKEIFFQSYFVVFRKSLLGTDLLHDFFKEIPDNVSYVESGSFYEYAMPGYFEERGYKSAVYCDERDDLNYPLLHNPAYMLKKYRMPLFKKRSFFHHYTDVMNNTSGEAGAQLIRFIEKETDYQMKLVWESILRGYSLSDIVRCAQLNKVLSNRDISSDVIVDLTKIGIVYYTTEIKKFIEAFDYLRELPADVNLLIVTNKQNQEEIRKLITSKQTSEKIDVLPSNAKTLAEVMSDVQTFIQEHEIVCFAHDRQPIFGMLDSIERSYRYRLNENMFGSPQFVENIVREFSVNKNLGLMFPAAGNHGCYAQTIGNGWSNFYDQTQDTLRKMEISVKTNRHTLCVAPIDGSFWFRVAALQPFLKFLKIQKENNTFQIEDGVFSRVCAYVAQSVGFYPSYLYNSAYTEIELTNLEFNKYGSLEMRAWIDALTMDSIGYKKLTAVFHKTADEISKDEVIRYYIYGIDPEEKKEYSGRECLLFLGNWIKRKCSLVWIVLKPIRVITLKIIDLKNRER